MRKTWLLLFFYWLGWSTTSRAQGKSDTAAGRRIFREADSLAHDTLPDYKLALNKLEAAKLANPLLIDTANKLVVEIYQKINGALAQTRHALEQERIALDESRRQQRISESGRLAATVEENCLVHPSAAIDNAKMAIQAIQLDPSFQSDRALRKVLAVFPPLETDLPIPMDPQVISVDPAHRLLAIGGYSDPSIYKLCVIDVAARKMIDTFVYHFLIKQVTFSPDDRLMAVEFTDFDHRHGVVEVRTVSDKKKQYELRTISYAGGLAFSPDNKYLAVGDWAGRILIYLADKDSLVATIPFVQSGQHFIDEIAFDCRGRYLMVNNLDSMQIWSDWNGLNPRALFGKQGKAIRSSFSDNGQWLGVETLDSIRWYHLPEYALSKTQHTPHLTRMQFASDSDRYLTYDDDGMAQIWMMRAGSPVASLNIGLNTLYDDQLTISNDGKYLLSAQSDEVSGASSVVAWDLQSRTVAARMFHSRPVYATMSLDRGTAALTIGLDRRVRWWGDQSCCDLRLVSPKYIYKFWLSGDQRRLAAAAYSNGWADNGKMDVSLFDLTDGHRTALLQAMPDDLTTIFLPHNESLLFTSTGVLRCPNRDGDSSSCRVEFTLPPVKDQDWLKPIAAAVSTDGQLAAVCDSRGKVYIFRAPGWDRPQVIAYSNPAVRFKDMLGVSRLNGIAVSSHGRYVALGLTGTTVILDTRKDRQVAEMPRDYRTQDMQFTPDEQHLMMGTELHPVNGKNQAALLLYDMQMLNKEPRIFRFDNDGVPGITAGKDGVIAVYQGARTQLYALPMGKGQGLIPMADIGNGKAVTSSLLSVDGKYLISCSGEAIRFVVLRPEDLIAKVLARMGPDREGIRPGIEK
jgi:WD40 repeat protein